MPHLTIQLASQGPIIDVRIGVSRPRQHALQQANLAVPAPIQARLLIDNGASCTNIDKRIIAQLGLVPTGQASVHTPSTGATPMLMNLFDVSVLLPHPQVSRQFLALPVIETDFSSQGIDGLFGRDLLAHCLFVFDGAAGHYSLAF